MEKTIPINEAIMLIRSMPSEQAIQAMKSRITGVPVTAEISGNLFITYKED